ncbi:MAG: AbrB/MazE/SpoVT family DNA-binding domain-containing protein [Methanomassiliicoccaceae archaeon]|nr:AbrB/MazE/SpoVT family DNA-binding domain-containing protein [Methanomassiliicoccaceae archaeon]
MGIFIQKWGNSNAIRIPKNILMTANMSENDEVSMTATENEIVIRKEKRHRTFSERMNGYEGKYVVEELDSSSVGMERFW